MKAAKRSLISPFMAMEVLAAANQLAQAENRDIVHMSLGQPGRGVPPEVAAHAANLMLKSPLGYTETEGITPLRERIAHLYQERHGLTVSPSDIMVTVGSSGGFLLALLAAFEPGDRVALVEPCYPAYRNILGALGIETVLLRGGWESNFQPTVAMLEALDTPVQGLILASPSNPAGTVIAPEVLRELVTYAKAHNIRVLSDEIYHGMTYGVKAETALALDKEAIILNSFSKYFMMSGWRIGWLIMPPSLKAGLTALAQNLFLCPPALGQYVALEMFNHTAAIDAALQEYAANRAILLEALPRAGFTHLCPAEGAFYIYADISDLSSDSKEFCRTMLQETGVAAVPGHDFDSEQGHRFVRFSYSGTTAAITEAACRLQAWLKPAAA